MRKRINLLTLLALSCWWVGCAGNGEGIATYDATGTVTLDGQPVEGAVVAFFPVSDSGKPAQSTTDADGRFEMSTYDNEDATYIEGMQAGDYTATVKKLFRKEGTFQPPVNQLPPRYADVSTSTLKVTVATDAENTYELKLEK